MLRVSLLVPKHPSHSTVNSSEAPFTWVCLAAETGMTCSWDFSKAEEKEQQVRAAKAARGKARQQKADRHAQRLSQQREKAALTLSRLTADSEPDATEQDHADGHASSSVQSSTMDELMGSAAHFSVGDSHELTLSHGVQGLSQNAYSGSSARHIMQSPHGDHALRQESGLTVARSLPVTLDFQAGGSLPSACSEPKIRHTEATPVCVGSGPLRRLASAAGYPSRHMTVPGPLLHGCAVESHRNSPPSMQSWQIVRPRPVKGDRAATDGPAQVNVHA